MLASKIRASSVAVSLSFCASKSSCCQSKASHLFFNSNLFFACCNRNLETAFPLFLHLSGNFNAVCFLFLKRCDDLKNLLVECRPTIKMSVQ